MPEPQRDIEQLLNVWFEAEIKLTREQIQEAGSMEQAVQNEVGPLGATVISVELF